MMSGAFTSSQFVGEPPRVEPEEPQREEKTSLIDSHQPQVERVEVNEIASELVQLSLGQNT
jgi:hypothetical protein